MTQISPDAWRQRLQDKLMAGLDAAYALIETSDDPARVKQAREKARLIGQLAAAARRVARLSPPKRPTNAPDTAPSPESPAEPPAQRPARAIDRLKGGRRGRL